MAFFEQIGKRLTDVGQGVAQQTKNITDVARLNSLISDKEKHIAQLYGEIGQVYYERHRDDKDAEELQKIEQINGLYSEIQQMNEEIKQIKGVVKCPNCGAEVAINASFCSSCGAKMAFDNEKSEGQSENARICPNCHAPVGDDNLFCNHCGTRL